MARRPPHCHRGGRTAITRGSGGAPIYWHRGYWTRPPYVGAIWVVPRYDGGRYYGGYWSGPRGRFEHDHHWDRDRDRDHGRWHEDNRKHKGRDKKDRDDHDRD